MILTEPLWLDILLRGVVLAIVALLWVLLLVRILGLRSFSKMTSFDFVMTVAAGSLLAGATQAEKWSQFVQPIAALAGLFLIQWILSKSRRESEAVETALANEPIMLMRDGKTIEQAMERARVTREDLVAKLREANVLDLSEVRAVVLETTGDISVLHGDRLSEQLLEGVKQS